MASISTHANGDRRILFTDATGKRRTIYMGKASKRQVEHLRFRVEHLNTSRITGQALNPDTAKWLADVGVDIARKLAKVGLVGPRQDPATLDAFLAGYINGRTNIKPRTRLNLEAARQKMVAYFGAKKPLREITPGDADAFREKLHTDYAEATAARWVKHARQFFRVAVRKELVGRNPFEGVKAGSMDNPERLFFVTQEMTAAVLEACPDVEWRAMIALCRYGGLRCPSEVLSLRWSDIDWEKGRFLVRSPKLEHTRSKGLRMVPLFSQLRHYLEALWDAAPEGDNRVITLAVDGAKNFRTRFERIIQRAGLVPWERPFQNLRASRETELAARHPLHVVTAWIGNSVGVAQKHYLSVTEADFEAAILSPALEQPTRQPTRAPSFTPVQGQSDGSGKCLELPEMTEGDRTCTTVQVPPRGVENEHSAQSDSHVLNPTNAPTNARGSVEALAALLGHLPAEERERLARLLKGG